MKRGWLRSGKILTTKATKVHVYIEVEAQGLQKSYVRPTGIIRSTGAPKCTGNHS